MLDLVESQSTTQASFPPSTLFDHCANRNSAHRCTVGTLLAAYKRLRCSVLRRATPQRRIKMKISVVMGAFLLGLLIAGCNTTPAPGPAGPQGQTGQTGQSGQPGDQGQSGQQGATGEAGGTGQTGDEGRRGKTGDQGRPGQTGDQGRPGQTGDQGRPGQTGDQGRQGNDAPCPAGEHHYTNPNTGRVSCVRD
jgi:hypothetical protein